MIWPMDMRKFSAYLSLVEVLLFKIKQIQFQSSAYKNVI